MLCYVSFCILLNQTFKIAKIVKKNHSTWHAKYLMFKRIFHFFVSHAASVAFRNPQQTPKNIPSSRSYLQLKWSDWRLKNYNVFYDGTWRYKKRILSQSKMAIIIKSSSLWEDDGRGKIHIIPFITWYYPLSIYLYRIFHLESIYKSIENTLFLKNDDTHM